MEESRPEDSGFEVYLDGVPRAGYGSFRRANKDRAGYTEPDCCYCRRTSGRGLHSGGSEGRQADYGCFTAPVKRLFYGKMLYSGKRTGSRCRYIIVEQVWERTGI